MDKQQKIYLLLTATLIVWGIIGYQIYNRFNPKQEQVVATSTAKYEPQELTKKTSYSVNPEYRDPFLGKFSTTKKTITKKKGSKKNTKQKPFPKIIYNGIIEGASQSFIITINGNQETFTLKETINKVTLLKGNSEEITMSFNDETKTFKQQ